MTYDDYKKGLIILRRKCLVQDKMLTKQLLQGVVASLLCEKNIRFTETCAFSEMIIA